jgi:predicted MFS family arabinose efflux permease
MALHSPTHEASAGTSLPAYPSWYRWAVLAVGTLGVFAALGLARFGYATVLKAMAGDLHIANAQAGIIATVNLSGYLLLAVLGGALASRVGARVVAAAGLLVVGGAMLLTSTVSTLSAACLWRGITGLGSGAANVAIMGLWTGWFPPQWRGRAAGIAVAGSSVALIVTGLTVPALLAHPALAGWRACWHLFGLVALGIAVLVWLVLRDPAGTSATTAAPAPDVRGIYRAPTVWHLGAVYLTFGFSYIIYMTFFQKYLTTECRYGETAAGHLFLLLGVCSLFCGVLWGAVSDRIGRRGALAMVFGIQALAFVLFTGRGSASSLLLSTVLFGLTAWSIPAIMAAACGDLLGPRLTAAGLGFVTLFFGIGQALGPYVAGLIADHTHSFAGAFLLAAGVALAGLIGSLFLRHPASAHAV